MSERPDLFRGISWAAAGQLGAEAIHLVAWIGLSVLLGPEPFGLVKMVTIFALYANVLMNFGFGPALIQREAITDADLSSVFWLNLALGGLLTAALAASGPAFVWFYDEPALGAVSVAYSVNFTILAAGLIHRTVLTRDLRFDALAKVEVFSALVSATVSAGLALSGAGIWSLVAFFLSRSAAQTVGLWAATRWWPQLRFSWASIRSMAGFSLSVMGSHTVTYIGANIDKLIVGKVFGDRMLGLYDQAFQIVLRPVQNVSFVAARVLFPSFSRMQQQHGQIRRVFLDACRHALFVTVPILTGVAVAAQTFVLALFGEAWLEMVPVLQILCVQGVLATVAALTNSVFFSQGRADLELTTSIARRALIIVGSLVGTMGGITGVAAGKVVGAGLGLLIVLSTMGSLVDLGLRQQVSVIVPHLAPAMVLAVGVGLLEWWQPVAGSPALWFAAEVATGALLWLGSCALLRNPSFEALRARFLRTRPAPPGADRDAVSS